jgi:nucleoside-diphosphate-sugar epimerase
MEDEKRTVLLTGATGFIGTHAARALAGDGSAGDVVALVRPEAGEEKIRGLRRPGITLVEGSFTDRAVVRDIFRRYAPTRLLHLAAIRGSGRGPAADYQRVNVEGTETLLQESMEQGLATFIFCSSVGVHGTIPRELPATVATPLDGDSPYHRSKIQGEAAVHRAIKQGLNAYIVRPTITYGTGDNGFPATLVRLVRSRRFPLPRPGTEVHLLDVAALCRLFAMLFDCGNPGARTIIAADRAPVPLAGLVHAIHRHCHGRDYPRYPFLPGGAARLLAGFLGIVGSDRWRTRVRLISESWYYRTDVGISAPDYEPPDTLTSFPESMCR